MIMNTVPGTSIGGGMELSVTGAVEMALPGKEPLPLSESARRVQETIVVRLMALADEDWHSCLEPDFRKQWAEILHMVDRYQQEIAAFSHVQPACAAGCAACCNHWVEDVNSFEAEIIADHIRRCFPERVSRIVRQCRDDEKRLERLDEIVQESMAALGPRSRRASADPVDTLLAQFYRLGIPCPLLDNSKCLAYRVRPLTCRMYVNFSDSSRCAPGSIDAGDVPTYLFDLEEKADGIIDQLHFRFARFAGNTGLRSLLPEYLHNREREPPAGKAARGTAAF